MMMTTRMLLILMLGILGYEAKSFLVETEGVTGSGDAETLLPASPVGWGSWGSWSTSIDCSKTRTRTCDGEEICPGDASQSEDCDDEGDIISTESYHLL